MKRRDFLIAGGAALVGGPLLWTVSGDEGGVPADAGQIAAGLALARRRGRALLVLVVPEAESLRHERGSAFGAWLSHGSDLEIAPLARCEVVCARMVDLRRAVDGVPAGEPLMVAVDPAGRVRELDADLAAGGPAKPKLESPADWAELERRQDEAIARQTATLARLVRSLFPDAEAIDARAGELAASVRARLVSGRVEGSRWATSGGCGVRVDGDTDAAMVACGMGHVPERARRFLYFFAATPGERMRRAR